MTTDNPETVALMARIDNAEGEPIVIGRTDAELPAGSLVAFLPSDSGRWFLCRIPENDHKMPSSAALVAIQKAKCHDPRQPIYGPK